MSTLTLLALFVIIFLLNKILAKLSEKKEIHIVDPQPKMEEHSIAEKKKTVVYSPVSDPISEFKGRKDDWYGEENE